MASAWPGYVQAMAWAIGRPLQGHCLAMPWPRPFYGLTMARSWLGPWSGHSLGIARPWPGQGQAMARPWPGLGLAMAWPWPDNGRAMAWLWPDHGLATCILLVQFSEKKYCTPFVHHPRKFVPVLQNICTRSAQTASVRVREPSPDPCSRTMRWSWTMVQDRIQDHDPKPLSWSMVQDNDLGPWSRTMVQDHGPASWTMV